MKNPPPGSSVENELTLRSEIEAAVRRTMSSGVSPIANWLKINTDSLVTDIIRQDQDYLVYRTHPTLPRRSWLRAMNGAAVTAFVNANIDARTGTGLDLVIASNDLVDIIVTNHDGATYLALRNGRLPGPGA